MRTNTKTWSLLTIALLAGCGGGGEGGTPDGVVVAKSECPNQFVGSGSRVSEGGILQGGSNPQRAIDGNLGSFASLTAGGSDTGSSAVPANSNPASELDLRVTARSGLSFPAGSRAGAVARLANGVATQQVVTVTTYIGSVVQDTFDGGTQNGSTMPSADRVYSYVTTKAYDAVQFSVRLTSPAGTERPEVRVYEFCG